jgi:hypothetical protein
VAACEKEGNVSDMAKLQLITNRLTKYLNAMNSIISISPYHEIPTLQISLLYGTEHQIGAFKSTIFRIHVK